jgi:hypothetical protein
MKPFFAYGGKVKEVLGETDLLFSLNITVQVMAITDVSA